MIALTHEPSNCETGAREIPHTSVMIEEVVTALRAATGMTIYDGTLGFGGHSERLLAAGANVIGVDQDPQALAAAQERLAVFGERFVPVRGNYCEAQHILNRLEIPRIQGALLDLGVSSWQLDRPERGFSFMREGNLDMRMNPDGPTTAADLINGLSEEELAKIFREYGDEPAARRIAARIARDRREQPIMTTLALADAVASVVPRYGRTHPATRVFQALRIAVNREIEVLEEGLRAITARLEKGARFAVISFHSGEDRVVKTFFKQHAVAMLDRPEWPAPKPNPEYWFKLVPTRALTPSEAELAANPRSRSAKLRIAERV